MASLVSLTELPINQLAEIVSLDVTSLEEKKRYYHLGFIEKAQLRVVTKAPLFGSPLLIEIKGSQIALSKEEAHLIKIRLL